MNVGTIFRYRLPGCDRLIDRLRPFDRVGRLRHVWFGWMFLHGLKPCNKPAFEGRA